MSNEQVTRLRYFRKKVLQPMRPYVPGEDMTDIRVGCGCEPREGGMVAHNPSNELDKWYISPEYLNEFYEEVLT